jgi:hypothetical protein
MLTERSRKALKGVHQDLVRVTRRVCYNLCCD